MKPSGPGLFCFKRFLRLLQFRLLLLVCSGFLLLLHSVLKDYIFLEMCPFHLGFQISWHTVLHSNFLQSFVLLWCQLESILFISNFVYLDPLSFFMMSLLKGLSILFIFSKNQLLDSLILRIVLLLSMSFNSALILVISFLLLALGCLCCCSSSSCRCRVRLFVWNVSIFLR